VGVHVHEPGGEIRSVEIDVPVSTARLIADAFDAPVIDQNVCGKDRPSGAIENVRFETLQTPC